MTIKMVKDTPCGKNGKKCLFTKRQNSAMKDNYSNKTAHLINVTGTNPPSQVEL